MPNTKDVGREWKAKILSYGPSGVGKTHFIKTIAEAIEEEVFVFDAVGWIDMLRGSVVNFFTFFEDRNPPKAAQFEKIISLVKELRSGGMCFDEKTAEEMGVSKGPYGGICFDSLTSIGELAMNACTAIDHQYGFGGVPNQHHYLPQMKRILDILILALSLPCHVYFTAHESPIQNKSGNTVALVPMLYGQRSGFYNKVTAIIPEVYHAEMDEDTEKKMEERGTLLTCPDGFYIAKTKLKIGTRVKADFRELLKGVKG